MNMKNKFYQPNPIAIEEIELSEEVLKLSEDIAKKCT